MQVELPTPDVSHLQSKYRKSKKVQMTQEKKKNHILHFPSQAE